jgi:hypothetical protein
MLKGKDIQQAHTQMTIDWLREMYDIKTVVAVDIIDHSLLLEKCKNGFTPPVILWIKSYLSYRTKRVIFNGSFCN